MSELMSLQELRECLLDIHNNPIAKRTHAAFLIRTEGSEEAARIIAEALGNRSDTDLMRHELAYILGQMQYSSVCGQLEQILADETDETIVRHECAEALGAIGDERSVDILKKFVTHPKSEISETCQISLDLIAWRLSPENITDKRTSGDYLSVDPAPPSEKAPVAELRRKLMDENLSLFNRYRAMFALRNLNTDESALALTDGFKDRSALFRHEIAYVLGQMQRSVTSTALISVLRNLDEHAMVRHEAAEALGAIGGTEVEDVLGEFTNDHEKVVQESCFVALNILDHWAPKEAST